MWPYAATHFPHQTVFLLHRETVYALCLPSFTPQPDALSNSMYLKSGSGVVVVVSGREGMDGIMLRLQEVDAA